MHSNASKIRCHRLQIWSFQEVKIFKYICCGKSKMECFVLNVYIVFIYINVDKRNTLRSKITMTSCSKIVTFHQSCKFNTFRNYPEQIPDRWCIIHTSLLTTTPDTRLALLLWKQAHILAKSAIFYKAFLMSTHLKGPTSMLIFWNNISILLCQFSTF